MKGRETSKLSICVSATDAKIAELIEAYDDVDRVAANKIVEEEICIGEPDWPEDIDQLTDDQNRNLSGRFVGYDAYIIRILAHQRCNLAVTKDLRDSIKQQLIQCMEGSMEHRKNTCKLDPIYIKYNRKYHIQNYIVGDLEAVHKGNSGKSRLLSRDVEFRTLEKERFRRETNIDNIKRPQSSPIFRQSRKTKL